MDERTRRTKAKEILRMEREKGNMQLKILRAVYLFFYIMFGVYISAVYLVATWR